MRLNEICQLDTADVRMIDGIHCLVVPETSMSGDCDKNLKTGASERLMPIHRNLIDCGFLSFEPAASRQRDGQKSLRTAAATEHTARQTSHCRPLRQTTSQAMSPL